MTVYVNGDSVVKVSGSSDEVRQNGYNYTSLINRIVALEGVATDINDLPTGLTNIVAGHKVLALQSGLLVVRDASDLLDRPNHTGTMPYTALGANPTLKLRSAVNQSIKNDNPWPVMFDTADLNVGGLFTLNTSSTTITAGSNGVALPTGTINVADTTGFDSAGSFSVNGPPGSGICTRVEYTGKTGTTFTGCTQGNGTLATSQVVKPSNDTVTLAINGVYLLIGSVGFNAHATGYRGIRFAANGFFATGELEVLTTNTVQTLTTSAVISISTSTTFTLNAYQNSGAALTSAADVVNAPTFTVVRLGA